MNNSGYRYREKVNSLFRKRILESLLCLCLLLTVPDLTMGQMRYYPSLLELSKSCRDAYLSGDSRALSSFLVKFQTCMDTTEWREGSGQYDRLDFDVRKYESQSYLAYLCGEYKTAVLCIDKALSLYNGRYRGNPVDILSLYIEKAQSQFMVRDYPGASVSLFKSDSIARSQRFHSDIPNCKSAYALSLAYCGDFGNAIKMMDELESMPSGYIDARLRPEVDRRRAKILILKAESMENPSRDDYRDAVTEYVKYFASRKVEIASEFSLMSSGEREGFWLTQRQFIVDCYRLGKFAPGLVYDAALFNKNLLLQFSARNSEYRDCCWNDVRKGLPEKGAAIEFIQYRRDTSMHLAAAVITKNCKSPAFIYIGRTEDILAYRLANRMTVREAIIKDSRMAKNILYADSTGLWDIIWNAELRKMIDGCRDVYFSADGFLHQLAIENFHFDGAPVFHRLTSTRNICRGCSPVMVGNSAALICGDMDFQAEIHDGMSEKNDSSAYFGLADKGLYFRNLEWSGREIDSILAVRSLDGDSVLSRDCATEQAFRDAVGEFKLVHISSHGYFNGSLEVPAEELTPHKKDNTLSQSVIFFSGANANLHNDLFNPTCQNDGLISAREISDMDLSNLSLCVLAACQTGLGDVTADGVYGIQRGLKNAGAGAMVLSLWSVDDKATNIMMAAMYRHLSEGEDVRSAFGHARGDLAAHTETVGKFSFDQMRQCYVEKKGIYDEPYYRDAFILIDDIK